LGATRLQRSKKIQGEVERVFRERIKIERLHRFNDAMQAGRKLYETGKYFDSWIWFRIAVEIDPQSEDAKSWLKKAEAKLEEKSIGNQP